VLAPEDAGAMVSREQGGGFSFDPRARIGELRRAPTDIVSAGPKRRETIVQPPPARLIAAAPALSPPQPKAWPRAGSLLRCFAATC